MRGISELDHLKIEAVKEYLSRYRPANENYRSLEKLNTEYSKQQRERSKKIMAEVETAIALLEVSRGKTIIEKRFILSEPWKYIYKNMDISRDTGYTYYRKAMLQLYDCMVQNGIIGEFVCDEISEHNWLSYRGDYGVDKDFLSKACLNYNNMREYGNEKKLYAWRTFPTL